MGTNNKSNPKPCVKRPLKVGLDGFGTISTSHEPHMSFVFLSFSLSPSLLLFL